MIIGLVPGAMKPYHAGHHFLVEKALSECDQVIIFTTSKDRGQISGMAMQAVWTQVIIPLIDPKVQVSFVSSPVGEVFNILEKENEAPTAVTYRLYGGTEDLARFPGTYIKRKFPNVADRFVNVAESESGDYLRGVGESPMVKGEWIRKAMNTGNIEKFKSMMPVFLRSSANQIFNMLR